MDEGGDLKSVLFWDSMQSWGPGVVRPMGGWEVMCRQLCEGLAARGVLVDAYRPAPAGEANGVRYWDSRHELPPARVDALIVGRNLSLPRGVNAGITVTAAVDDPRHEKHTVREYHVVCLSEWQASLFREQGFTAVVIPSMIDDWIYDLRPVKRAGTYCCVNAWNKGTDATLRLWKELALPGELTVGSPYGAPPDAAARCHAHGARWIGQLSPRQVVAALSTSEAVFRVCEREETFGVTDAIAEVVGTRVHALFTNGVGASPESLFSWRCGYATDDREQFVSWVTRHPMKLTSPYVNYPDELGGSPLPDYRVSTIIPRWIKALGLE